MLCFHVHHFQEGACNQKGLATGEVTRLWAGVELLAIGSEHNDVNHCTTTGLFMHINTCDVLNSPTHNQRTGNNSQL